MKVCAEHRKELALLAVGALGEPEAEALRAHVAECAGCRGYLGEIDQIAAKVSAAEAPEMEAAPFLHRRVRHRLLEERPRRVFPWRLLIPAMGAVAFVVFFLPRQEKVAPAPAAASAPVPAIVEPTVSNYQIAADQSLEKLDDLLTRQGNTPLPSSPVYRAGGSFRGAAD